MNRTRFLGVVVAICAAHLCISDAAAQRFYIGSTPAESQYSGANSLDANGRTMNAEGRAVDPYGHYIGDYGLVAPGYRMPGNVAGNTYYPMTSYSYGGYYYPGGYSGLTYMNGLGYSVGLGGYSGGFYSRAGQFGAVAGRTYIAPPRTVVIGGVYPSRTVMNNSTRGGVVEYTHNGNGYIYSPGTSYQTVLSNGPSIFPTVSVVQPTQPPTLIETRPSQTVARPPSQTVSKTFSGSRSVRPTPLRSTDNGGNITLMYPKDATIPLTYVLNGTTYSIKPGYTQTIIDDRPWTIEFPRGGSGSIPMRYDLKAGTYQFVFDESGWDLKAMPAASGSLMAPLPAVPPSPAAITTPESVIVPAPVPSPDL